MIFQIFLAVFALLAILKTHRQYKARKVSIYWYVVWTSLWVLVIAVAYSPQTTDIIASYVGVEKGADLLVYSSIVVLFYALYRLFVKIEKQNKELTELVRMIAVKEGKKFEKED